MLKQFDPPGFLPDLARVPGLVEQWSAAVSFWFDASIKAERDVYDDKHVQATVQYFNPTKEHPPGPVVEQAITWNAFPKELLRQFGRERALHEADRLWPLSKYKRTYRGEAFEENYYRPLNEYCEWHVFRDGRTGKIRKVAFTSEPPEYYRAMFGDAVEGYQFQGDRRAVLDLYRELAGPAVEAKDLVASEDIVSTDGNDVLARKGAYNPYNKWNTTHGIVHLIAPPNTLTAEIRLGADATVSRKDSRGRFLVEPEVLICCAGYGGPDRNSDPTIGSSVNALARFGAMITLKNPVGLYMDHIDLAGWTAPDGQSVADLVKIVRGQPGMIERLEVEVPEERGFSLSDVTIGGVPIAYGGQIAECITVKLTGVAVLAAIKPVPVSCDAVCWIDPAYCARLGRPLTVDTPQPPGTTEAFVWEGEGAPSPAEPKEIRAVETVVASVLTIPAEKRPTLPVTSATARMRRRL
jgi:hypothetical protein